MIELDDLLVYLDVRLEHIAMQATKRPYDADPCRLIAYNAEYKAIDEIREYILGSSQLLGEVPPNS